MSLGGLIPIGGSGSNGGKKSSSSDLTGGLISISSGRSASAANDVDVSDFDIDDLLSDTPVGGKKITASGSKGRSSAPSPPLSSSDVPKDKKKSKDGKKKKDKKSKGASRKTRDASDWSVGDDNDDDKDASKSRDWGRESTEFAVPVKKSGALDAEFAKMLGLEDEMGAPSPPIDDDKPSSPNDTVNDNDGDDASSFKYTPTIRGTEGGKANAPSDLETAKPLGDDKPAGGLSAAFFSDDAGGGDSASLFYSLSSFSTSERRGGRRSGRRSGDGGEGEDTDGAGGSKAPVKDPFASKTSNLFGSNPAVPSSLDVLFGSGKASLRAADDPFVSRRDAQDDRASGDGGGDPLEKLLSKRETKDDGLSRSDKGRDSGSDDKPLGTTKKLSTPPKDSGGKASSAQDDLLAELLSRDDKPKQRDREEQLPLKDEFADLSSEGDGFGGGGRRGRPRRGRSDDREEAEGLTGRTKEDDAKDKPFPTSKPVDIPPVVNSDPSSSRKATMSETPAPSDANKSARDSLLMDLLGDLPSPSTAKAKAAAASHSPPPSKVKPSATVVAPAPPTPQPKAESEEQREAPDPPHATFTSRSRPSPAPSSSPPAREKATAFQSKPAASSSSLDKSVAKESPPPSPGRARTLTSATTSSVIKESDFEQSKDSLLEELLTPTPSAPPSPVAGERSAAVAASNASDSRGNSYSQSFDGDEAGGAAVSSPSRPPTRSAAAVAEMPSMPAIPEDAAETQTSSQQQQVTNRATGVEESKAASRAENGPPDVKSVVSSAPPPSTDIPRPVEPPASVAPPMSNVTVSAAASHAQTAAVAAATATAMAKAAQREQQLRVEVQSLQVSQGAWTQREQQLEASRAALTQQVATLAQQLNNEKQHVQQLISELSAATEHHTTCDQEKQTLRQQLSTLQSDKLAVQRELTALTALHGDCGKQQTLAASALEGVQTQLMLADERNRQLVRELTTEARERQAAQLKWQQREQQEDRERDLARQREKLQMDTLFQQLQSTLAHLQLSHGLTAVDEQRTRSEVESAARMRMLSSLEATSKSYAQRSEDECHRLAALLSTLETLLRGFRQEHIEEKERLRQEQLRLDVLAAHFQAQSAVLHERADANSQLLAKSLAASLQDARTADARVSTRRQQLEDHERALFQERAEFAAYREQVLEQHAREEQSLAQQHREVDARWRELEDERADLEAVIAAHELDFQQLQRASQALEEEKNRVAERTEQVAQLAQRLEQFTSQMVSRETEAEEAVRAAENRLELLVAREKAVKDEREALGDRERRLHQQLRQLDRARGRLNEQRKQHLEVSASSVRAADGSQQGAGDRRRPRQPSFDVEKAKLGAVRPVRSVDFDCDGDLKRLLSGRRSGEDNQREHSPATSAPSPVSEWRLPDDAATDPSGLSPALRKLVEDNWKRKQWRLGRDDASVREERLWISCVGLDTTPSASATGTAADTEPWRWEDQSESVVRSSVGQRGSTRATPRNDSVLRPATRALPPPPPLHGRRKATPASVSIDL